MQVQVLPLMFEAPDLALDFSDGYDSIRQVVSRFLFKGLAHPGQLQDTDNSSTGGQKPGTEDTDASEIQLAQLKGGITNVLLKGSTADGRIHFLIRAYGRGTSALINRDREYETHVHLLSKGLAPPLYARFANGLVYGFTPGRPVHYRDLSHPVVIQGISGRIAQWHALLDASAIDSQLAKHKKSYSHNLWELLDTWLKIVPAGVLDKSIDELRAEIAWFQQLAAKKPSKMVVAHCDLLSGNVLIPEDCELTPSTDYDYKPSSSYTPSQMVKFIDYEYTMPAARAFDLANHFMEWQGFDCATELIPTPKHDNQVLRYWCYHYLSSYNHYSSGDAVSDRDIDELIDELRLWWGVPGLYWGIWAAIQSSISNIDFDYAPYAANRLSEYFLWKKTY